MILLIPVIFSSCEDDPDPVLPMPTIENVEIGLNNNEIGVIGRDFHLNADILAGHKIDLVQVKIEPIAGESYDGTWSFELTWEQYKGAKNTNVHKHFDIPEDAVEGRYDFFLIVTDENGTALEEKRNISIYKAENLPVDPQLELFSVSKNYNFFYRNGDFLEGNQLAANDTLSAQATIGGVKGVGKMYLLLIKKSLNHRPESIDGIDFSKVIVYDVFEHKNEEQAFSFSNAVYDFETFTWTRRIPSLTIGGAVDNNAPQPSPVNGEKSWESGGYYLGVVYTNTTHNMSFFHYLEIELSM